MSQSQSNVIDFQAVAKRAWQEDFKERWKNSKEGAGEYTNGIWEWTDMLVAEGWRVELYDHKNTIEFSTLVDFDNKILINHNPKAYHAHHGIEAALDMKFNGGTGRHLFYWQEVHDEAHRHVRDGDEYKDSEYYMTVWYSMELYHRELTADEEFPVLENV